ncbi:MAG: glycine cleavage system protein GcvH [Pseudomonadota bacterium]
MSNVPGDLRYTESHEWIRAEDDGTLVMGITEHAQAELGELVFVDLPEAGQEVSQGDALAVVESTKAASDVYSPVAGELVAVNTALDDSPDLVNQHPYDDGWILRLRPSDDAWAERMLDAEAYRALISD